MKSPAARPWWVRIASTVATAALGPGDHELIARTEDEIGPHAPRLGRLCEVAGEGGALEAREADGMQAAPTEGLEDVP
jgi:hypothetical protein